MYEPHLIPGMIEPVEQQMLTDLAADPFVAQHGAIVEFGTFFGRSTTCLIKGAVRWWSRGSAPAVYAFDSFSCIGSRGFAREVRMHANKSGLAHLVQIEGDHVNFRPVYDHYVGEAETFGILRTIACDLRDVQRPCDRIALMHLDSPKFYEELKYVLERFFPALVTGAHVVFQDYFYHWSASLIAAVQCLVERGFIVMERSAASALLTRVLRAPTVEELLEIDRAMREEAMTAMIDRAIATVKAIPVDRPEQFMPRLYFAKMQRFWELGEFPAAEGTLLQMLSDGENSMTTVVFNDFRELLRHGFSVRKAYELDHSER
jgi:hypothetical protein